MSEDLDSVFGGNPQSNQGEPSQPGPTETLPQAKEIPGADLLSKSRKFSWALFAVILICFFLPFVQVSCQDQKLTSMTGLQLALGTEIEQESLFGPPTVKKVDGDLIVLSALLLAGTGLAFAFVKGKEGHLASALCGAVGFLLMLFTKMRLDDEVLKKGHGMLTVEYAFGFIAACLFFLLAAVAHGYLFMLARKMSNRS